MSSSDGGWRSSRLRKACCFLCAAALLACSSWPPAIRAADDGLLREQIEAGEFAPALNLAGQAAPAQRDAMFNQIAGAQARGGDRRSALATAGQIGDDAARSQTFEELASDPLGGQGGAVEPDFESLIELITTTIAPQSWDEVGGPGSVQEYENGVRIDALGVLQRLEQGNSSRLEQLWHSAARPLANSQVRRASPLRKVSLPRLEKHIQLRLAAGKPLDPEMLVLAGLQKITHIMVYPAGSGSTGDLVLAGPAGDWHRDSEGRLVGVEAATANSRPVLQLDDLVVMLRHMRDEPGGRLGCSINPVKESLARIKEFLEQSAQRPLKPGRREAWLEELRATLGRQVIEVYGVDPHTRVARVMVEADYRMKLVGIGLEEGTPGVPSYLDMLQVPKGQQAPPMGVLRWWFDMNYSAVRTSANRDIYELDGQGVRVLSENELLTESGEQVHTGKSDELNQRFAHNFTRSFADLAARYPVYADLQNVFDLALTAALIQSEDLAERTSWHMTCLGDEQQYRVALGNAPQTVETVINHKVANGTQILAAVSGGVRIDTASLVKRSAIALEKGKSLDSEHTRSAPLESLPDAWWWD